VNKNGGMEGTLKKWVLLLAGFSSIFLERVAKADWIADSVKDVTSLQDSYDEAEERVAKHKPNVIVPIATLGAECDANSVRTESKYENKIIQTTGVISDFTDFALSVTLEAGSTMSLMCGFSRDSRNIVSRLNKGEEITVRGLFDYCMKGYVNLRGCVIVSHAKR
jgi:hypothetical protein